MSQTPDQERDAALRALLRQHTPAPPTDQVDWRAMQQQIAVRAQPLLQQRRIPQSEDASWLGQLALWSGRALPIGSAVAVLLAVILLNVIGSTPATHPIVANAELEELEFLTVEEELAAGEVMLLAGVDEDAFLEAALLVEREDADE